MGNIVRRMNGWPSPVSTSRRAKSARSDKTGAVMPKGQNLVLLLIFLLLLGVIIWLLLGSRRRPDAPISPAREVDPAAGAGSGAYADPDGLSAAAAATAGAGVAGVAGAGALGAAAWEASRGEDMNEPVVSEVADVEAHEAMSAEAQASDESLAGAESFDVGADGVLHEARLADDEGDAAFRAAEAEALEATDREFPMPDLSGDADDFDLPKDGGLPGLTTQDGELASEVDGLAGDGTATGADSGALRAAEFEGGQAHESHDVTAEVAADAEGAPDVIESEGFIGVSAAGLAADEADGHVGAGAVDGDVSLADDAEIDASGLDDEGSAAAYAEVDASGLDDEAVGIDASGLDATDADADDGGPFIDASGLDADASDAAMTDDDASVLAEDSEAQEYAARDGAIGDSLAADAETSSDGAAETAATAPAETAADADVTWVDDAGDRADIEGTATDDTSVPAEDSVGDLSGDDSLATDGATGEFSDDAADSGSSANSAALAAGAGLAAAATGVVAAHSRDDHGAGQDDHGHDEAQAAESADAAGALEASEGGGQHANAPATEQGEHWVASGDFQADAAAEGGWVAESEQVRASEHHDLAAGAEVYGESDEGGVVTTRDGAAYHQHEVRDGGWSVGSAAPIEDGCQPLGHPIKGVFALGIYQVPGSDWYEATVADVWFTDENAAQRAGFRRGEG
ncbi:hypothetical protein GCM10009811_31700 [Nostocoides veronense]|uniref:Uncharacterized protein n=2 Tax=Nostocoides veronense TaxID=330836 RepID=A0ABN2M135_9MICO